MLSFCKVHFKKIKSNLIDFWHLPSVNCVCCPVCKVCPNLQLSAHSPVLFFNGFIDEMHAYGPFWGLFCEFSHKAQLSCLALLAKKAKPHRVSLAPCQRSVDQICGTSELPQLSAAPLTYLFVWSLARTTPDYYMSLEDLKPTVQLCSSISCLLSYIDCKVKLSISIK